LPVSSSQPPVPGRRPAAPLEPALWAAIGLAITPRLLMFGRRIFIDIYISMFLGLTLLCFALVGAVSCAAPWPVSSCSCTSPRGWA
jgi:4-amino-4-deoxy-L-arabinose transferase-like glycosyltransferase